MFLLIAEEKHTELEIYPLSVAASATSYLKNHTCFNRRSIVCFKQKI